MTFSFDPAQLDRWNGRFSAEGYLFGKGPNAFLASQRGRLAPGMHALSVADGEGRNSVWLAQQGLRVTAFDFSPVGLEKARALAREAAVVVDYRRSDIYAWDWSAQSYDVVVAIFFQFAAPAERAQVFAGLLEALAPGGLLILQGYRPEQLAFGTGGPLQVEKLYTEALLRESFASLEILHLASHDDVVDEGPGHRGMSALIDLVARRAAPAAAQRLP
ncbi:MAG: class I SAM-dependent methyltransferase [Usitatibacter sp.]